MAHDAYILGAHISDIERDAASKQFGYVIRLEWSDKRRTSIIRTHSMIYHFHCDLLDEFPEEAGKEGHDRSLPFLPGKRAKGTKASTAMKYMEEIEEYICQLLSMDPKIASAPSVLQFFTMNAADHQFVDLERTLAVHVDPATGEVMNQDQLRQRRIVRKSVAASSAAVVSEVEARDGFICAVVAQVNSADFSKDEAQPLDPRKSNALLVPDRLVFQRGETLYVISMDGCPQGHWRCRNGKGEAGFVPSCDVAIDATIVATRMNDIAHAKAVPSPPPARKKGAVPVPVPPSDAVAGQASRPRPGPPPRPKADDAALAPSATAQGRRAAAAVAPKVAVQSQSTPVNAAVLPKADRATAAAPAPNSGNRDTDTYAQAIPSSQRQRSVEAAEGPGYESVEPVSGASPDTPAVAAASGTALLPPEREATAEAKPAEAGATGPPKIAITPTMLKVTQEVENDLYSDDEAGAVAANSKHPDDVNVGTMYGNPLHQTENQENDTPVVTAKAQVPEREPEPEPEPEPEQKTEAGAEAEPPQPTPSPRAPRKSPDAVVVKGLYDYTPDGEGLSFAEGETIQVQKQEETGWWFGVNAAGESGWFPSNYVE